MKRNMIAVGGSVDNEGKIGFSLFPHKHRKGLFVLRLLKTGNAPFGKWDRIDSVSTPWADAVIPYADKVVNVMAEHIPLADADFAALFPNCEEISLRGTCVSDISPLSALRRLRHVDIAETCVTDVNPLQCMKKLKWLDVSRTRVSDISVLTTTRCVEYLDISYTNVKNISAVGSLKRLRTLYASDNEELVNIEPLWECTALRSLTVSDTNVGNLDVVKAMPWLHTLSAARTLVGDDSLYPISRCRHLWALDISGTDVRDLSLGRMDELRVLRFSYSNVERLRFTLPALEVMEACDTFVDSDDIITLWASKNLTYLDISKTNVTDISPLKRCRHLTTLKVADGYSAGDFDFSPLKGILTLRDIDVSIRDARVTATLPATYDPLWCGKDGKSVKLHLLRRHPR